MPKIPVYYSSDHQLHRPLYEYDCGYQIAYQEVPERIESARDALGDLPYTLEIIPEMRLTDTHILSVHSSDLLAHLKERSEFANQQDQQLGQFDQYLYPWIYPLNEQMRNKLIKSPDSAGCFAFDTYAPIGRGTWQAVFSSANLAYCAAQSIADRESRIAYALCRPPGHHAGRDTIGGYCYLNNAALAADQLRQTLGRGVILDIDYHHGNGTQEIFWNNPDVFFISIHADPAEEYPFFSGFGDEMGGGDAPESNLNIPLPKGCDNPDYLRAVDQAITSIQAFQPNWIVLSAGFDTSYADPSTFFALTDDVFVEIGKRIGALNLPIVIVHEGGYAVEKNGILAVNLLNGIVRN